MLLLKDKGGGAVVFFGLLGGLGKPLQALDPECDLKPLELVAEGKVFFRLFGLLAQGLDLELKLGDLVADAKQIVLGALQAALGLLLAVAVFRDARGLLKDLAAVGALE